MLAKAVHATPLIAGIINVRVHRHDQRYAARILLPESPLAFPGVASSIQITVRGHLDRHARIGTLHVSSLTGPLIAAALQESVCRHSHRRALLGIAAVAAVALFAPSAASAASDTEARIQRIQHHLLPPVLIDGEPRRTSEIAEWMEKLHVPGVSIAVIHNGRLDWARGFGVVRIGGPAVTPATLFQACSISKAVSATAMLHLAQQGRLGLDADVNAYLRSWKLPANAFTAKTKVTLRQLLNHSADVTVSGFPGYLAGSPLPTLAQMPEGVPPAISPPIRVDMLPGIGYRYSGGGYLVAQQVVEDITNKPFADVVRDTVLSPYDRGDGIVIMTSGTNGPVLRDDIVQDHEWRRSCQSWWPFQPTWNRSAVLVAERRNRKRRVPAG